MSITITFQRLEAAALFLAFTAVYFLNGFSLVWYLLLILVFDISMLGYLAGNKVGAICYNLGHNLIPPSVLMVLYLLTIDKWMLALACLWFAHIGMDRALGYGLKLTTGFKHTHLGDIGHK